MKNFFKVLLLVLFLVAFATTAFAGKEPLDEIQNYLIEIDMAQDGDAIITYHFDWKVLDDASEGPLEYLYVGIPNKHCSELKAISDNIKSIEYSSSSDDGNGHFAKIYFYRKYYKDEEFSFDFSIKQGYLYILNEDNSVTYAFTPGWFPEIEIKNLELRWNSNYVTSHNADFVDEMNRLVWQATLAIGESEKLSCEVTYPQARFDGLSEERQSTHADDMTSGEIVILIVVIVLAVILLILFFCAVDDGYGGGGGVFIARGGGGSSCACASCACACACAGGGRAGCSAKNIYGADTNMLKRASERVKARESKTPTFFLIRFKKK